VQHALGRRHSPHRRGDPTPDRLQRSTPPPIAFSDRPLPFAGEGKEALQKPIGIARLDPAVHEDKKHAGTAAAGA
jgi:hypothetical protein